MTALAPGLDPLIAEAKLRMRRRRVLATALVLLAAAAVLFFILRPSGGPGTTGVTSHGANGTGASLAHLKVPVDDTERKWQAGINAIDWNCACGLTAKGVRQVHDTVVATAHQTGAVVVRLKVWSHGSTEVVLATGARPAEYLKHHVGLLFALDRHSYNYLKVVDGKGARIYELYGLPREDGVWVSKRLNSCAPNPIPYPMGSPPCPVK